MSMNVLDTPPSSTEETQPGGSSTTTPSTKEELIRGDFKVWLLLLVIICLAGLSSLSFFTFSPAPSATLPPTSTSPAYTDGVCTSRPADIQYLASASSSGTSSTMLSIWSQTGKTQQDLANVEACAASFTLKYEQYSAADLKSLEACVPMLSAAARQRFYTPNTQSLVNRMDSMWRANIQKQQLVRTAQVQQPAVINVQSANRRILVWVSVRYALTIHTNGDTYPSNATLTVLLVTTPSTMITGTGWQVSGWNEGTSTFQPTNPL